MASGGSAMRLNEILQATHFFSRGYNQAQDFISKIDDTSITYQNIDDYFKIIRYIVTKISNSPYIATLTIYKNIVNYEQLQLTDNPSLNSFLNSLAQLLEVEVAKSQFADELVSFVYSIIDRDFKDITTVFQNYFELSQIPEAKFFILNTTPIIQAKVKKSVKESMEKSKNIARLQEL